MTHPRSDSRPSFASARLRAEPVERRHAAEMVRMLSDPRIHRYLPDGAPTLERLERQYEFLEGGKSADGREHWLTWIVRPRAPEGESEPPPIGYLQATVREPEHAHIAYVLHPLHWRKGYAREMVSALLDTVFTRYRVAEAIAEVDTGNQASIALARSLGFQHVRTAKAAPFEGGSGHEHVFVMRASAWDASESITPERPTADETNW